MTIAAQIDRPGLGTNSPGLSGVVWLFLAVACAALYFHPGIEALFRAWSTPEYSHGPLIPVLSGLLFLRQLRDTKLDPGPITDRGVGVAVLLFALLLGGAGRLIQINDLVGYSIVFWVGGILLLTLGWRRGRQFWPPVLHLMFMLPLPEVLYYGLSTYLQGVSSQLGVFFLRVLNVPVFLDGNIIDLGVYKLQVAEACSGLRYLFPILSFSYIFSVLYRGPFWHKALLLLSAAPLTVLMNSIRIAIAGAVVDRYGIAFVEGVTHFLEGWVIFVSCVLILFAMARVLLFLQPGKLSLAAAMDLNFDGLWTQVKRLRLVTPSPALIGVALLVAASAISFEVIPPRPLAMVEREPFSQFPNQLADWKAGTPQRLDADIEKILGADDYYSVTLQRADTAVPVDLFMAWYRDQINGGTHSPTDCLPGAGWEITKLTQLGIAGGLGDASPFTVNRAEIQKGAARMLVYYWYDQQGERTPSTYYAKFLLTKAKVLSGRSDGALVRLVTAILPNEGLDAAERRLQSALRGVIGPLPRFIPPA